MTTAYPAALDNFTNPASTDLLSAAGVSHADQHANVNDAVEALQAKVGVDGSAVATSHEKRITDLEELETNEQTGTAYTLVLADGGKVVEMNNGSANTLTVPPNSSVAFPVGVQVIVLQTGAGQTTIAAGSGVTVNSAGGNLKITSQWSKATLLKRATDSWVVTGSLSA